MKLEELKKTLELHSAFLESNGDAGELANLRGANLWGANLRGANLRDADLRDADLRGADLRGADLWGARLWGASLWGADLRGADLRGASLWGASLWGASLWGADLRGADLWGATGNGREIKSIQAFRYPIAYTSTHIFIGCEGHTISDWERFTPEEIHKMDGDDATIFWNENKKFIFEFISKTPATPVTAENKK